MSHITWLSPLKLSISQNILFRSIFKMASYMIVDHFDHECFDVSIFPIYLYQPQNVIEC